MLRLLVTVCCCSLVTRCRSKQGDGSSTVGLSWVYVLFKDATPSPGRVVQDFCVATLVTNLPLPFVLLITLGGGGVGGFFHPGGFFLP